jgi:hypothetical protein
MMDNVERERGAFDFYDILETGSASVYRSQNTEADRLPKHHASL